MSIGETNQSRKKEGKKLSVEDYKILSLYGANNGLIPCLLRVCLDLEKLEGKKKSLESCFLSIVWFEESQKEKK